MVDIETLLDQFALEFGDTWNRSGMELIAPSINGRYQTIRIHARGGEFVLISGVLDGDEVCKTVTRWRDLARLTWQINSDQEIVSFRFDESDTLIGEVRHPAEHLDYEELRCYVLELAKACDRLEYLLSGRDLF